MALKQQMGLGGFSASRGHVQVHVQILDLDGVPLFGKGSAYVGAQWRDALAHARYWLSRGHTRVRISDGRGRRAHDFLNRQLIGWRAQRIGQKRAALVGLSRETT